ncbi:MAG: hypothetical protein IJE97_10250, partial [Thermoguttaceae bacterium]|nr:hypothetical protein [Thermoguttaceae bacterium]
GGDVVVDRDSVVGSNVWPTKSIAPRSTIVIEKPRLVVRENRPPKGRVFLASFSRDATVESARGTKRRPTRQDGVVASLGDDFGRGRRCRSRFGRRLERLADEINRAAFDDRYRETASRRSGEPTTRSR